MAKSKRLNKTNKIRKPKSTEKIQIVYSEKRKIFKEKYLTKKGKVLMLTAKTKQEKEEVWKKYGKNKYINNPNSVPIGQIIHRI